MNMGETGSTDRCERTSGGDKKSKDKETRGDRRRRM